ncbi:MAG TPA: PQQ-like beta-propeller repeat protein [Prolixibacteraceae bacterium]|nr:PQQ-like beta-propeller repeat protein [Prolixibacteraceae bacterium]HPS12009.1 PQQ-like beta-propeller repeat protein [Prolixibacteraceae bacterium]
MKKFVAIFFLLFSVGAWCQIPQFRGPNRDGNYPDKGLLKQWPENGPQLLLEINGIGGGWSSAVVYNNNIYITGMTDSTDCLSCIDFTGTIRWKTPYASSWNQSFPDTRSTPTLLNGKAYVSSGRGVVACIDADTGKMIWSINVFGQNEGITGNWGVAESILIVGGKAIFTTGGNKTTMVALDAETGKEVWKTKSLNDNLAYVSPILIERNGRKQIIGLGAKFLFGVNPDNGNIDWSYDYCHIDDAEWGEDGAVINCTSPIYHDGFLYVTSGYNHTGAKFKLKEDLSGVEFLWKDELLDNHHGGVVLIDGYIYGSNWVNNGKGDWCCISFDTGEKKYEETFKNKGSIVAADGMLYIYTEQPGFVGLVKPNPEKFELVSSFQITKGTGPCWAHPSIYDGKLFIRHGDVLMVYDIKNNP